MNFKKREQFKYSKKPIHKRRKKKGLLGLLVLIILITSGLIGIIIAFYSMH